MTIERSARLVPVTDDPDTGGFFAAAADHRLAVRRCCGCGRVLHLPRAYCSSCGGWEGEWHTTSGRGRLFSWTTVERQVHEAYPVPYTIVLVDLEDVPGARFVGRLDGAPPLTAGQELRVWFEVLSDGVVLPQWSLV